MTDNEIIKAYEGLTANQQLNLYRNLYYNDGYATERGIIANAINDILPKYHSQKEEIEELEAEIDKQYEQAKADILGNMADGGTSCHWCIEQHKLNAFKEFAERLEETKFKLGSDYVIYVDNIKVLVKELEG